MYLKSIHFANLPINNTYENVYDSKEKLIEVISSLSSTKTITFNDNEKGFNANKKTKITLNVDDLTNVPFKSFNYCRVVLQEYVFQQIATDYNYLYFITGYEYEHSSNVVTFFLEYDEWHNNVDELYDSNKDRKQFYERLTESDFRIQALDDRNLYVNKPILKDEPIVSNTIRDVDIPERRVLFLRVLLNEKNNARLIFNFPSSPNQDSACDSMSSELSVYYIPFCVVYKDETIDLEINDVIFGTNENRLRKKLFLFSGFDESNVKARDFLYSIMISADLTYYSPYLYTINSDTISTFVNLVHDRYRYSTKINLNEEVNTDFVSLGRIVPDEFYTPTTDSEEIAPYMFKIEPNEDVFSINKSIYQYRSKYYPYNYVDFTINDAIIPYLPESKKYPYLDAKVLLDTAQYLPTLSLSYYGLDGETKPKKIPLKSKGTVPIVKDALTEFLRTNKSQLSIQLLTKALDTVFVEAPNASFQFATKQYMKGATTVASDAIDLFSTFGGTNAKLMDIARTKDSISTVTGIAYEDIFYQDYIVKSNNYIADENELNKLNEFFERYGVSYFQYENFGIRNFHKFDFYQIKNADLILTDKDSLLKIYGILSRGVRIWHIKDYNNFNSTLSKEAVNLSYKRANVPMIVIETEGVELS